MGLKGFAPSELEPRTSDGELVADLLASAGAEFERKGSNAGSSPASVPSPLQARHLMPMTGSTGASNPRTMLWPAMGFDCPGAVEQKEHSSRASLRLANGWLSDETMS